MEAPGEASGIPKPDLDAKKAAGRKKWSRTEKALAELEFSNPGVKAVVGSRGTRGAAPLPAPLPAQIPKAQSSATASSVIKGPGAQQVISRSECVMRECECEIHALRLRFVLTPFHVASRSQATTASNGWSGRSSQRHQHSSSA